MAISAALVKVLRERTGAGMMDCKNALQETDGDIEAAIEAMRKSGTARAAKKAGRLAAEGVIALKVAEGGRRALLLEVNSETDFVANDDHFRTFVEQVAATIMAESPADPTALSALAVVTAPDEEIDKTIEQTRQVLVARVGENISIRRFAVMSAASSGVLGTYLHAGRIGVVVELTTDNAELAKDLAMHIAASRPLYLTADDVPAALLAKEREILTAQATESGKPAAIIEKMVAGRLNKFIGEITLSGQPFVKDPDIRIAELLQRHAAGVTSFTRFEVGEGLERREENFAEQVMQQAGIS